jgi:hypothetical protein
MTAMASEQMRPALEHVLDARLHNLDQEALLFDPSPECDSAIEMAAAMLRPDANVTALIADQLAVLRRLLMSNRAEGGCETSAAGLLDRVTAELHASGPRSAMTIKTAAAQLRPHLKVADRARREVVDSSCYFRACCAIGDVVRDLPDHMLRGPGLRGELGAGRHDVLLGLLPATGAEAAA